MNTLIISPNKTLHLTFNRYAVPSSALAASSETRRQALTPDLIQYLRTYRPKDVPQHAEKIAIAINESIKDDFIDTLQMRLPKLTTPQAKRAHKIITNLDLNG